MSASSYNRGSRVIAREADDRVRTIESRHDRQALHDENERLRQRVEELEHDLKRARRCLAAERFGRAKRTDELKAELRAASFGTSVLTRLAFGR